MNRFLDLVTVALATFLLLPFLFAFVGIPAALAFTLAGVAIESGPFALAVALPFSLGIAHKLNEVIS